MIMFYPKMSVQITASAPHPEGTEYRISIGEEDWDGVFQTVTKVQMVYNGKIAGRKSPSYPFGSDDCTRVYEAIAELEEKYQNAKKKRSIEHFPAKQATYVPVDQFVELICRIPQGCITRWEDLPVDEVKAKFKEIEVVLPYSRQLKQQGITGTLSERLSDGRFHSGVAELARAVI